MTDALGTWAEHGGTALGTWLPDEAGVAFFGEAQAQLEAPSCMITWWEPPAPFALTVEECEEILAAAADRPDDVDELPTEGFKRANSTRLRLAVLGVGVEGDGRQPTGHGPRISHRRGP